MIERRSHVPRLERSVYKATGQSACVVGMFTLLLISHDGELVSGGWCGPLRRGVSGSRAVCRSISTGMKTCRVDVDHAGGV